MKDLLILFIVLNIVNVIIQTVKSIATIKCGKGMAALINALAYGFYTVVTIYTLCELPLLLKAGVVALCNLVGVYVVKYFEEKARKDKLWKVEMTVPKGEDSDWLALNLKSTNIPFNYIENVGKYTLFNVYCATQEESKTIKRCADSCNAKYFVSETKTL